TPGEPVWGWADVHEHQFANEAYGGAVLWGKPFDERGVNKALAWCDYTWDFQPVPGPTMAGLEWIGEYFQLGAGTKRPGYPVHGSNEVLSYGIAEQKTFGFTVNIATNDDPNALDPHYHHVKGIAESHNPTHTYDRGWPHYMDGAHQQMYYKWLERAYKGGMRLLINMAVNNEVLAAVSIRRKNFPTNDMDVAYKQIQSMKDLERFIDRKDDGLINESGWYRIAYSPEQARRIIEDGNLAVIISIEVDSLFNCRPGTEGTFCTEEYIRDQIDTIYRMGVRHVFPVHLFDNAFAGAAIYGDIFSTANIAATGEAFDVYDCSGEEEGFDFKLDDGQILLNTLLGTFFGDDWMNFLLALDSTRGADCNAKGLTDRGVELLHALMDKGMLIDIDHFSHRAMVGYHGHQGALDIFEARDYPPVSSHTVVMPDVGPGELPDFIKSEGTRTELKISRKTTKRIAKLGGGI
ncbi:MAG: hypothetical protein GY846_19760, partial [Deltaproteobacteria bacterium]|nr:hypothetical protein [Deltaproteobacteria bacterium]